MAKSKRKVSVWVWVIIVVAVILLCVAGKTAYDKFASGTIEISNAPDAKMRAHIISNQDKLAEKTDLFTVTTDESTGYTTIAYIGEPDYEQAYLLYAQGAVEALTAEGVALQNLGYFARSNQSEFLDFVTPWSAVNSSCYVICPNICELCVYDYTDADHTDKPLHDMVAAIEAVIGTP